MGDCVRVVSIRRFVVMKVDVEDAKYSVVDGVEFFGGVSLAMQDHHGDAR